MAFDAQVLADSISPDGVRLTTFQVTYPHAVHKDMLTHCALARNYLSFRAYPTYKLEDMVMSDCFIPEFEEYGKGMSVGGLVNEAIALEAKTRWLLARDWAWDAAKWMIDNKVNKGHANILIQDFCWITGIMVSGGRVARVSYLTHDGKRDPSADIGLHDDLIGKGHMSPFDHQAWPIPVTGPKWVEAPDPRVGTVKVQGPDWRGKYFGWCPYRKTIPNEENYALAQEA
jgi:hypothetical protein